MPRSAVQKFTMVSVLCILITGCAVPTSLKVASLALDVVSYATTQKSVMDHGLSLARGEDCAMLRMLSVGSACKPYASTGIDFNGNLISADQQSHWSAFQECDTAKIAKALPDRGKLSSCASRLIQKFGDFGALNYADKHIETLINASQTDQAGIWTAVHLTVRQQIDVSYGRVAEF